MASSSHKKHRSGKRPAPESMNKFLSKKTEEAYHNQILLKSVIAERGIEGYLGDVRGQIEHRRWERFVQAPIVASVGLVREFYANATERKNDYSVYVRGKWVSFASEDINSLFQLPDLDYDQYTGLQTSTIDYSQILNHLTHVGAEVQWKWSGSMPTNFPASGLHSDSKIWHHFISARLFPSGHLSEVTRERALLNFAIQKGYSIDVGKIISQSLLRTFQAKTAVSLGHPSVIHGLCVAQNVDIAPGEEVVPPRTSIRSTGSFPTGILESELPEASSRSHSGPAPHHRGKNLTVSERVDRLSEDCRELKVDVRGIKTQLASQGKSQRFYNEQNVTYQQYMMDYHHHHAMTSTSPEHGGYPVPPPRFTHYQEEEGGEQEEEEEEEEEDQ